MSDLSVGLRVLACVYREARELFPLEDDSAGICITVQIDQLTAVGSASAACAASDKGYMWLLARETSKSARVRRVALFESRQLPRVSKEYRVLPIGAHILKT